MINTQKKRQRKRERERDDKIIFSHGKHKIKKKREWGEGRDFQKPAAGNLISKRKNLKTNKNKCQYFLKLFFLRAIYVVSFFSYLATNFPSSPHPFFPLLVFFSNA